LRTFLASPTAEQGDGTHHLGFHLAPPAAYATAPAPGGSNTFGLGVSVDLSGQLPPIGNQGSQGSCVAWATSYYYKTWSEKQEHAAWSLTSTQDQFSPSFVYNQINGGADNGSSFTGAFNLLQTKGDVDIAEFPYNQGNWTNQPSAAQLEAAKAYRIPSGWYSFWNQSSDGPFSAPNSLDNAKAWLASGKMLVMGIPVYDDFPNYGGNPKSAYYDYNGSAAMAGGHGVCIVGYDDNANPGGADADHKGGFKMVNSWGSSWNNNGFVYLSYDFVKRYVWEAWTMGDNSPDTPSISSLSAGSGGVGTTVLINGKNFGALRRNAKVTFNGTAATDVSFTDAKVTAKVPAGATTGSVKVYDWEGTASNGVTFTVSGSPLSTPSVSSASPATGENTGAVALSVLGSAFVSGCQVTLARTGSATIGATGESFVSSGRVDCSVDLTGAAPGAWDVVVTNPDTGSGRLAGGFGVTAPAGSGDSYEPNDTIADAFGPLQAGVTYSSYVWSSGDQDYYRLSVPAGCASLTANLTSVPAGCDYDLYVYNSAGAQVGSSTNADSADEKVSLSAPGAGTFYLKVDPYSGSSVADAYSIGFTTTAAASVPTITTISPGSGLLGSQVTIKGRNLGASRGSSSVTFRSTAVAASGYISWSDTQIVCRVPTGAWGKTTVNVTTGSGKSNAVYYQVVPKITSFTPASIQVGRYLTIIGQGFGQRSGTAPCVYFGSTRVSSYGAWKDTSIVVKVPGVKGRVSVTVKTAGGSSSKYITVF